MRVTAQCPSLCENMSRPCLWTPCASRRSTWQGRATCPIAQYSSEGNRGHGAGGTGELNDWEKLKSDTVPQTTTRRLLTWMPRGFAHSHLMCTTTAWGCSLPYHVRCEANTVLQMGSRGACCMSICRNCDYT